MKKFLIVFVAALMLVTTGCGSSNKLECSMNDSGEITKYIMEFDKNDKLTAATMSLSMPFEEELTDSEKEEMKSYMSLMCSMYDYEGVECKADTTSKSIELELKLNFDKMSDETKSTLGFTDTDATYDQMKANAEEDGFTCK